ncbi:MAG: hypothetical protein JWM10_2005 [Myxococcaceae bacterium]|nr:hypothetical protein [Myxococcaceae bacterium]
MRTHKFGLGVLVLLTSCGTLGRGGGLMGATCSGDLGGTAGAQKVEAFIAAANSFATASAELQTGMLNACRQIGRELAIPDSELGAGDSPDALRAACTRVSNQLRADLTEIRASGGVRVELVTVAPHCEISVDAYGRCAGECDASYTPGSAEVTCEGGEMRGGCSAQCTGHCAVEVSGACNGVCEGTCAGSSNSGGECNGTCQGRCVARATGSCGGECRGGCSVAFTAPSCTGRVTPPRVNADCRAACDARLSAQASCTPGRAELTITGNVGTNLQEKVAHVQAALRGGFSQMLLLRRRAERAATSGARVVTAARELPNAIGAVGAQVTACAGVAASGLVGAVASVDVSVSVSVQVSGSVSAN